MDLKQQSISTKTAGNSGTQEQATDKVISLEECKKYIGDFNLPDNKIIDIRNFLIGVADKTLDSYLETFK